jgi:uncharacterized protein (DUF2147 family)
MQKFQDYFYNARKPYEFRIKIANMDINKADVMEAIKNALDAYEVETITTPKRLPVQEHRDFGKLGPCEVHVIDVVLNYPTIAEQVRQLVINRALVPNYCICVETMGQAQNEDLVNETILAQAEGEGAILEKTELPTVADAQATAGQARVDSLLKELMANPMSQAYEIAGTDTTVGGDKQSSYAKTTNDLPMGDVAPVGTKQNYVYRKSKGNK